MSIVAYGYTYETLPTILITKVEVAVESVELTVTLETPEIVVELP